MKFELQELATLTQGKGYFIDRHGSLSEGFQDTAVHDFSFSIDTRTLQPGQVFIALQGANSDGHAYLPQAFQQGAAGAIVSDLKQVSNLEHPLVPQSASSEHAPFILNVTDSLQALQAIARACRQKHPIPALGITGSNGKTTVKDMTAAILDLQFQVVKSQKSFNNHIGLPLTLANLSERHEVAVLEMGMNAPGELRHLASIARPDIAVITNIARAHFGFFHSLEAIMQAKMELIQALPEDGIAILHADDTLFERMCQLVRGQLITFGLAEAHEPLITACNLREDREARYTFDLVTPNGQVRVKLPLPGRHNVQNALAAAALLYALDQWEQSHTLSSQHHFLNLQTLQQGLEQFSPSPMRMQVTRHDDVTILNDAYNANPASMAAALNILRSYTCAGKKLAVLGDMRELGELSVSAHYDVGQLAAAVPVAKLLLMGDYARDVARGAQAAGMAAADIVIGTSHESVAQELVQFAAPGDLMLLKASRGMLMENVLAHYLKLREQMNSPSNVECS